jgi:hypothetical protein
MTMQLKLVSIQPHGLASEINPRYYGSANHVLLAHLLSSELASAIQKSTMHDNAFASTSKLVCLPCAKVSTLGVRKVLWTRFGIR